MPAESPLEAPRRRGRGDAPSFASRQTPRTTPSAGPASRAHRSSAPAAPTRGTHRDADARPRRPRCCRSIQGSAEARLGVERLRRRQSALPTGPPGAVHPPALPRREAASSAFLQPAAAPPGLSHPPMPARRTVAIPSSARPHDLAALDSLDPVPSPPRLCAPAPSAFLPTAPTMTLHDSFTPPSSFSLIKIHPSATLHPILRATSRPPHAARPALQNRATKIAPRLFFVRSGTRRASLCLTLPCSVCSRIADAASSADSVAFLFVLLVGQSRVPGRGLDPDPRKPPRGASSACPDSSPLPTEPFATPSSMLLPHFLWRSPLRVL